MRKLLMAIAILGIGISAKAQEPCAFDRQARPFEAETNAKISNYLTSIKSNRQAFDSTEYTIPVVVHVFHDGGAENITMSQINGALKVLNDDFGKAPGSMGDGNGADTRIQFKLAKINPDGKCTNGVVRIRTKLTDHRQVDRQKLKDLSAWDNKKYFNIYIVRTITGNVGGYASFPGGPDNEDGIVVRNNLFGTTGTSNSLGRTLTHETGHWLGLYHTFQDGCGEDECTTGDLVCDTPPISLPSSGCPTGANTCSNDSPDMPDNIENYMDYSSDACQNMLSEGQSDRMKGSLETIRTQIWTAENLVATGIDTAYVTPETCPVVANFSTLSNEICIGNGVEFHNTSLNTFDSVKWVFPGGSPSESTMENPLVRYDSLGVYSAMIIAYDSLGADTMFKDSIIRVNPPGIGEDLKFFEGFESGVFPDNGITLVNYDQGITWQLDSNAAKTGKYSIKINNLINTNYGTTDEIVLPFFNLNNGNDDRDLELTFDVAYARSDPSFSDELYIQISRNCGQTFTNIFTASGQGLATGPTQTTPFIPDSTQWRSRKVNLNFFKQDTFFLIRFVNVTDGGNNLYLDNIRLRDKSLSTGISETKNFGGEIFPNPSSGILTIRWDNSKKIKTFEVINSVGQLVETIYPNSEGEISVDLSRLPKGFYVIQPMGEELFSPMKWIKN
jgi:PKD repeat protein